MYNEACLSHVMAVFTMLMTMTLSAATYYKVLSSFCRVKLERSEYLKDPIVYLLTNTRLKQSILFYLSFILLIFPNVIPTFLKPGQSLIIFSRKAKDQL